MRVKKKKMQPQNHLDETSQIMEIEGCYHVNNKIFLVRYNITPVYVMIDWQCLGLAKEQ